MEKELTREGRGGRSTGEEGEAAEEEGVVKDVVSFNRYVHLRIALHAERSTFRTRSVVQSTVDHS
jgi:hypothetical protein